MKSPINPLFKTGLLIPFIVLIGSSVFSYLSIQDLIKSSKRVDHTQYVLLKLQKIFSSLKDAEEGHKGYIITRNEFFLKSYLEAKEKANKNFHEVQQLTIDNKYQQLRFDSLEEYINARFNALEHTLKVFKEGKAEEVIAGVTRGAEIMKVTEALINRIKNEELILLSLRTSRFNNKASFVPIVILFVSFISLFIVIISVYKILVDAKRMVVVEEKLRTAYQELEVSNRKLVLAKENAENATILKSRFLANMSHEIRTPLNAIIGFSEVLQKQNLDPIKQKDYLVHIVSSGKMLLKLIGDILDLSKVEEGKLQLNEESFHFKEVLKSAITPYKFKANEKGLRFNLQMDEFIPDYVIGDPYRINQIIINLIGNSLKFTHEGGVVVNVANVSNRNHNEEVLLKVSVSDTGIGILKEKQEFIFNSFVQADSSIIRKYGGSGLGLSIVKQLVNLMGGELQVESPNNLNNLNGKDRCPGTTISFSIPLKIDRQRVKQALQSSEKLLDFRFEKALRILAAEDNLLNQQLASLVLESLGCCVDFANNGEEAIEFFEKNKYDIILMDVQMPIMDGLEASKKIRIENKEIPIIGLTANVFKEDVESCLLAGMNDHLGKPYNEEQLYNIFKKWCK